MKKDKMSLFLVLIKETKKDTIPQMNERIDSKKHTKRELFLLVFY